MIKRLSYIFILFISLFIVTNVKAFVCSYDNGTKYTFDTSGNITSFHADKAEFYQEYSSPHGSGSNSLIHVTGSYDAEIRRYDNQPIVHELHKLEDGAIKPDKCPDKDEISYSIDQDNECTVKIKRSYYCRNELANCYNDSFVGCTDKSLQTRRTCINNGSYACVWVNRETGNVETNSETDFTEAYCNVDNLQYVQCGNAFDIPTYLPKMVSFAINLLKILTPIILVFTSAITLLKAITASKEDEMTKAKNLLVRRIVAAVIIFFTITITQFVIEKVAEDSEAKELRSCLSCFINNKCETNKYYKNNIGGDYKCFYVSDSSPIPDYKCH